MSDDRDSVVRERDELRAFIADSLPFLREAWEACFHGQKERLLSAEERGMGRLLAAFQAVADGKPPHAPGWVSARESAERVESAIKWAHDLLGDPNEPHPAIQRWCSPGLTAAHGLKDAHAEVERLEAEVAALRALPAVPPSPAERLARAADRMATADAVFGKAIKDGTDWKSADRAAADAYKEFTEALAAYRAAPPAAEPVCLCQRTTPGHEAWCPRMGEKPDLPCGTDIGPSDYAERDEPPAELGIASLGPICGPAMRAKPEPAPCGTCGGCGFVGVPCPDPPKFVGGARVSCAVMHTGPCPSCRPGGAA
jgi:hypothetical protein